MLPGEGCMLIDMGMIKGKVISAFGAMRPEQNGRHLENDISKWIFLKNNLSILFRISLKFAPKGAIDEKLILGQVMAWCWKGGKPLLKQRKQSLLIDIYINRPQWVNCIRDQCVPINTKQPYSK